MVRKFYGIGLILSPFIILFVVSFLQWISKGSLGGGFFVFVLNIVSIFILLPVGIYLLFSKGGVKVISNNNDIQ